MMGIDEATSRTGRRSSELTSQTSLPTMYNEERPEMFGQSNGLDERLVRRTAQS